MRELVRCFRAEDGPASHAGLREGLGLYPDDPDDPRAFGADRSWFGKGAYRIVFAGEPGTPATHLVLEGMVFPRRPGGDPRAA